MIYFGVDYYPEHWTSDMKRVDAQAIANAGFNVVRMGEFAWALMEPYEGKYAFDWLDESIGYLSENNVKVMLGTPTAIPPLWMLKKYPEMLSVDEKGIRRFPGTRRACCFHSPAYLRASRGITAAMADHYKDHENVVAWQIDNELSGPVCYCETCRQSWIWWLKRRYKTLDALNEAWGTSFWSATHMNWDDCYLPGFGRMRHNPSLLLDHSRFHADVICTFLGEMAGIVRRISSEKPVTANFMGVYGLGNYFEMAKQVDVASFDFHPGAPRAGTNVSSFRFNLDLMRSVKHKPFWIPEHRSGQPISTPLEAPGQVRLWTYLSVAHGADAILYWRWRSSRFGSEQFWHGIVLQDGKSNRRLSEISGVAQEMKRIESFIEGAMPDNTVAMMYSYDSLWAAGVDMQNRTIDYLDETMAYASAFYRENIGIDVVSPSEDIREYDVVVVPMLYVVTDELAERLENYVLEGGHVVFTFRSGVKMHTGTVTEKTLPGALAEMCAISIAEFDVVEKSAKRKVIWAGQEFPVHGWLDLLSSEGAEILATHADIWYEDAGVVSRNDFGRGCVWYVGCSGADASLYDRVVQELVRSTGIGGVLSTPEDVEATARCQDGKTYILVLNHSDEKKTFPVDKRYVNLLDDCIISGAIHLGPYGVMLLAEWDKI